MFRRMSRGGFPLVQTIEAARARRTYLDSYIQGTFRGETNRTRRDPGGMASFFRWLACQSGSLRDFAKYAQGAELSSPTVASYLSELRSSFLAMSVPAWHPTLTKRETNRERVFVIDSLLVSVALNSSEKTLVAEPKHGPLFETFVANELDRLCGWSDTDVSMYHWRRNDREEVDLVLEDRQSGRLVAIEVKAARESLSSHFSGIRAFKQAYPKRFHRGYLIHCGDHVLPHASDMWSLPFSALWRIGREISSGAGESRSLADALAVAQERVALELAQPEDLGRWIEATHAVLRERVAPGLEQVAASMRTFGFTVETFTSELRIKQRASMPRTTNEVELLTCTMNMRDERRMQSPSSWQLACRASVRANGSVQWVWMNTLGSTSSELVPSEVTSWNSPMGSFIDAGLIVFADSIPDFIARFDQNS